MTEEVSYSPKTVPGLVLRNLLTNGPDFALEQSWRERRGVDLVMYQAFVLAARRRFFGMPTPIVVRQISDGLKASGVGRDFRTEIDTIAGVVNGTAHGVQSVSIGSRKVLARLLWIAVGPDLPRSEIDTLVSTAEHSVRRLHRHLAKRSTSMWVRWLNRGLQLRPAPPRSTVKIDVIRIPRSLAGYCLRAIARYDTGSLQSLPVDPPDRDLTYLADGVFVRAMHRRFERDASQAAVWNFSHGVAALSGDAALLVDEVRYTVSEALALVSSTRTMDASRLLQAKVAAFAKAIEDIGCYDSELDTLVFEAEEELRSSGYQLVDVDPDSSLG